MAFKTLATITAATNVQAGDLIGTWRSAGPMTAATVTMLVTYLNSGAVLSVFPTKANNLSDLASAATARTNLGLGTAAVLNVGTSANNVPQFDGSAKITSLPGLLAGIPDVIVQNQRTSGTDSGEINFTTGANDRVLNTLVVNNGSIATLASNILTLPAGTYYAEGRSRIRNSGGVPSFQVPALARLYNNTDSAVIADGIGQMVPFLNADGTPGEAVLEVRAKFTLSGSKGLKLRTMCTDGGSPIVGGGSAFGFGTEVYSEVCIWKVA